MNISIITVITIITFWLNERKKMRNLMLRFLCGESGKWRTVEEAGVEDGGGVVGG